MLYVLLLVWLLCALATIEIYRSKGHGAIFGALVGFCLGPLGLLLAAVKPSKK